MKKTEDQIAVDHITQKLKVATRRLKNSTTAHKLKVVHLTVKKLMNTAAAAEDVRAFNVWNGELVDWNRVSANDSRWG